HGPRSPLGGTGGRQRRRLARPPRRQLRGRHGVGAAEHDRARGHDALLRRPADLPRRPQFQWRGGAPLPIRGRWGPPPPPPAPPSSSPTTTMTPCRCCCTRRRPERPPPPLLLSRPSPPAALPAPWRWGTSTVTANRTSSSPTATGTSWPAACRCC